MSGSEYTRGLTIMEWQRLDIRKASILKKQVDLGLGALKTAVNDGDANTRSALIQSFLVQIDEIEEFRSMNDSDERSILFERERLRLRKAVQEYSAQSAGGGTPSGSKQPFSGSSSSGKKGSTMGSDKKGVSFTTLDDLSESPRKKEGGIHVASGSPASPSHIYGWETEKKVLKRTPIAIEGTVFAPAEEVGVYVKDGEDPTEETKSDEKFLDMYFVLTADEVSVLASRIQKKSEDKAHLKSQASACGVQHSTPFVDSARIESMLYRQTEKEKWTGGKDLRPNFK